ncbi:MarR family winged helix-turn-helix transcriptional regulator [Peribacillus alkalitolerans]|uniref:MarR family winged helix-turn-helix transcriptional regulator n=1 Tax=Peribacillus alkalitolerans TaxID=1550385 RepID=UPI0013D4BC2E|nr:MarR family transcriptional regulator [Peribacillus alkalitolerans]
MENNNIFHTLFQVVRKITKEKNEVLQPFGLFTAQFSVLYVLKHKGSMTQTELCDYLSVEAPPMTRTLQRLETQGFIKKTPGSDKRTKYITLSDEAKKLYPLWEEAVNLHDQQLLGKLTPQQKDDLHHILIAWYNQF